MPIKAQEPEFDFVRMMCRVKTNLDFFPQMALKNFLEKNKGHEVEIMDLLPKVKELMNKDKYYETTIYIFKDFSPDEMDLYTTLKWSDFMKKVEKAEKLMKEMNLPTYEKEIAEMLKVKKRC